MRIRYDEKVDALYLRLDDSKVVESEEVQQGSSSTSTPRSRLSESKCCRPSGAFPGTTSSSSSCWWLSDGGLGKNNMATDSKVAATYQGPPLLMKMVRAKLR